MKKSLIFLFSAGIILSMISFATAVPIHRNSSFILEADQSYDNYQVRTYFNKDEGKGYFEILQNGKQVYSQQGFRFRIGLMYTDAEFKEMGETISNDLIAMGKDITGKGAPDLVVNEWTGGAHCCYKFHVFEIGKQFKEIATLDAGDGDLTHFEAVKGSNKIVFVASDWTFAYWNVSFADSPAPQIILSFQNDSYKLDFALMRRPPPPAGETESTIKKVQADESWKEEGPPPLLWGYMLDLIYSGNSDAAWDFFDNAWLPGAKGKEEFRRDFQARLRTSPYWKQIDEMNKPTKNVPEKITKH